MRSNDGSSRVLTSGPIITVYSRHVKRETEFQRSCQHRSVYCNQGIPNVGATTVIINETSPGNFSSPILIDAPWGEDLIINWPMDLDYANELKVVAGFTKPFRTVTLRKPLGPRPGNPLLIFDYGPSHIFVDTVTGDVTMRE
ncbi:hypothetical protein F8M41_004679 [Gigaspora margarita]|uniref:Uncharacterized protein n=1 Tax=Gigaspora margarita TaxID=4874 RepID=A0A8H4ERV6_GIGMA|nr:hypothetical protein F8M41_004679 [Gigaspora margarita]